MCKPATTPTEVTKPKKRLQGMNFVSQIRRLAMYSRDGFACAYCGSSVESGAKLTLDHIIPYSHGGLNHESNLVTCCSRCNSSRGNRPVATFVKVTAAYLNHGITAKQIMAHVRKCLKAPVDKVTAKELILRRGSCFNVLQTKLNN